ncbi:MAG: peptidylprolyl isomerase [Pseudomonadota bacterium]
MRYFCKNFWFLQVVTLAILLLASAQQVKAQGAIGVAAVVNDEPISIVDLVERIKLVAATSNMPMTPSLSQEMAPQMLRQLIDEQLQMQEAQRRGFEVTDGDMQRALDMVESNSNLPSGGLEQYLQQNDISMAAMRAQMRPQIAWQKLLGSMRREIQISDAEIDDVLTRIERNEGKPRNNIQEILLPIDNPQEEDRIRNNAREVIQALRNGASFEGLARQFSASTSAANGGGLGWVSSGEMAAELEDVINNMVPGQISDPIRTIRGYYIVKLLDRRQGDANALESVKLDLYQLFVPLNGNAPQEENQTKIGILQNARQTVNSCEQMAAIAVDLGSDLSGETKGISPDELAPVIRNAVGNLDTGGISQVLQVEGGALVVMICNRTVETAAPQRELIENRLMMERLEILARRKLRELRRNAFIDVRI